jgi:SET domain-containing protein
LRLGRRFTPTGRSIQSHNAKVPLDFASSQTALTIPVPSSKSPPYVIRSSPTHGRGVFASRTIRKGARIVQYRGARLAADVADNRPATDPRDPYHTLLFRLHDGTVLDASQGGNAARWINHGCDPNCEAIEYDDGRVFICAKRTIRAGEELRYDYRLEYDGRLTRLVERGFACRCGARHCRGTMLKVVARRDKGAAITKGNKKIVSPRQ